MLLDLLAIGLWTLDPLQTKSVPQAYGEPLPSYLEMLPTQPLKVLTWNIKFGGGRLDFFFDGHDTRSIMSEQEVSRHLDGICALLDRLDPDIVFLQEVDRQSKRSAYMDQMEVILQNTPLKFGLYASHWHNRFIPKHQIGQIDSGNAILSKWPLHEPKRHPLPLIGNQDALTQYFYLQRCVLGATIKLPGDRTLRLLNTHLSAFAQDDTKRQQIQLLRMLAIQAQSKTQSVLFGGDLNTPPPGTTQLHQFSDVPHDGVPGFEASDFRPQTDWIAPLYARFNPVIDHQEYVQNQHAHFTHSTHQDYFWNRKLDYLFSNLDWTKGTTYQDQNQAGSSTMELSDHAPVGGTLTW